MLTIRETEWEESTWGLSVFFAPIFCKPITALKINKTKKKVEINLLFLFI